MNKDSELEYLMNPILYDKYQKLSSKERETLFLQDKQFYRKRIQQMAKDCSKYKLVKGACEPPKSLITSFDAFAKQCIIYFKTIDENECYQKEYHNMVHLEEDDSKECLSLPNTEEMKQLDVDILGTKPPPKIITMDNFVEKKTNRQMKPLHLPKQKNANVKDDKYRTKGLKKKNKSKD
jgi:hypothetical protein